MALHWESSRRHYLKHRIGCASLKMPDPQRENEVVIMSDAYIYMYIHQTYYAVSRQLDFKCIIAVSISLQLRRCHFHPRDARVVAKSTNTRKRDATKASYANQACINQSGATASDNTIPFTFHYLQCAANRLIICMFGHPVNTGYMKAASTSTWARQHTDAGRTAP